MTTHARSGPQSGPNSDGANRVSGPAVRSLIAKAGLLLPLAALFALLSVIAPNFLTVENQLNVLRQVSFVGIIAAGMTFVIVAAEIDISVGSATALASVMLAFFAITLGVNIWLAVGMVLLEGVAIGALIGFVRTRFNVPSFIVTLAFWSGLRGFALLVSNAYPVSISDPTFRWLGTGHIFDIPVPAVFMIVVFVVLAFVSRRTAFGRSVYAVGGNASAARLAGINNTRIRIATFCMTGALAAMSGVLISARVAAGTAGIGVGMEFDVISAVIVGGTNLFGGRGTLFGTFLGVLFIGLLSNGMVLVGVNPYAQQVAQGAIVLLAVILSGGRGRSV